MSKKCAGESAVKVLERIKERVKPDFQKLEVGYGRWYDKVSEFIARRISDSTFLCRTELTPMLVEFRKKWLLGLFPIPQKLHVMVMITSAGNGIVFDESILPVVREEMAAAGLGSNIRIEIFEKHQPPQGVVYGY